MLSAVEQTSLYLYLDGNLEGFPIRGSFYQNYSMLDTAICQHVLTVLPEPVWAQDMRSLPAFMIGMEYFCTGVGFS